MGAALIQVPLDLAIYVPAVVLHSIQNDLAIGLHAMTTFELAQIDPELEDDLKAEARQAMFSALRKAFKHRRDADGILSKDLANALQKDPGYVSRVLNGTSRSIDFETLYLFLEALKFHLPLEPVSYEELATRKPNFDARPGWSASTPSAIGQLSVKTSAAPQYPKISTHNFNIRVEHAQ